MTSALAASAVLNVPFHYQITATNSPTIFGATNLPPGLIINTSTGVISGTPSATGSYNVTINATNEDGQDTPTLVIGVDSDEDSRSNLEEYAFGGSPLVQDFAQPVSMAPAGAEMIFGFAPDIIKTDLQITPQLSDALALWTDGTAEFVSQVGNVMQWRVRVPLSVGRKFKNLRATLTPERVCGQGRQTL